MSSHKSKKKIESIIKQKTHLLKQRNCVPHLEDGGRDFVIDGLLIVLGIAEVVGEERLEVSALLGDALLVDVKPIVVQ